MRWRRLDGCGADAELVALAKRCLAADPAGRPRDAGEVAAAVTAYRERAGAAASGGVGAGGEASAGRRGAREPRPRRSGAPAGSPPAWRARSCCWRSGAWAPACGGVSSNWSGRPSRAAPGHRAGRGGRRRPAAGRGATPPGPPGGGRRGAGTGRRTAGQQDAPEQRRLVEEERATLGRVRDEFVLADRLDEVRVAQAAFTGGHFDTASADAGYRDAFARHGMDLERMDAAEAAKRIRAAGRGGSPDRPPWTTGSPCSGRSARRAPDRACGGRARTTTRGAVGSAPRWTAGTGRPWKPSRQSRKSRHFSPPT